MKKFSRKLLHITFALLIIFNTASLNASAVNTNNNTTRSSIAHTFTRECLGGRDYEYTTLISTKTHNTIIRTTPTTSNVAQALAAAFDSLFPIPSNAASTFTYAALNCIEANAFNDADPETVSMKIVKYKHPGLSIGGNEYYKYIVYYYKQANLVGYIGYDTYFETYTYN